MTACFHGKVTAALFSQQSPRSLWTTFGARKICFAFKYESQDVISVAVISADPCMQNDLLLARRCQARFGRRTDRSELTALRSVLITAGRDVGEKRHRIKVRR